MKRSISGPILLLAIGGLFLWRNLHPEAPIFELLAQYWPFVLIAWGLLRLIEALVWRENGVRGSFSGGEVVLIILICIAGSGIWTAREHGVRFMNGGLDFWGQQYDYPVSATASATGMKRIVFENPRGNIKVTGGDSKEVTVTGHKQVRAYRREEADATNSSTQVEIVPQGDRLVVRTNQDRIPNNQRISCDLEVTVPRGMAVESRSSNGDHQVDDIDGDVEITSSHGDVRLARVGGNVRLDISRSDLIRATDIKGRIDLQGRGSDVELENIAGQVTINGAFSGTLDFKNLAKPLQFDGTRGTELSAQAVPGRISMDLGEFSAKDITGPVRLVTRARDIKLEQFTQSVELETERGDIELTPGKTAPGRHRRALRRRQNRARAARKGRLPARRHRPARRRSQRLRPADRETRRGTRRHPEDQGRRRTHDQADRQSRLDLRPQGRHPAERGPRRGTSPAQRAASPQAPKGTQGLEG